MDTGTSRLMKKAVTSPHSILHLADTDGYGFHLEQRCHQMFQRRLYQAIGDIKGLLNIADFMMKGHSRSSFPRS